MLFYALMLLLEANPAYQAITTAARWVTVVVVPVIGLMFLVSGTQDGEYVRSLPTRPGAPRHCDGSVLVPATGLALLGGLALLLTCVSLFKWRTRWAQRHRSLVPVAAMLLSVLLLLVFGLLSFQPASFIPPRWAVIAFLVATTSLLAAGAVVIHLGSPDAADPPATLPPAGRPPEEFPSQARYRFLRAITGSGAWGLIAVRRRPGDRSPDAAGKDERSSTDGGRPRR